jgi:hypothetical protein
MTLINSDGFEDSVLHLVLLAFWPLPIVWCLHPVLYYYTVSLYDRQHNKFVINKPILYYYGYTLEIQFNTSSTFHKYCLVLIKLYRNMQQMYVINEY